MPNILFISYVTLKKLLLVFVAVSVSIWILLTKNLFRSYQLARKLPGPSLWKILTVHLAHLLSSDLLSHVLKLTSGYDFKPWALWTGFLNITVISDPDSIGEAFRSKNLINKDDKFYQGIRDYFGDSSLVLNGVRWKVRRNLAGPAFNKTLLRNNLDVVYEEADRLVQRLRVKADGTDFDIRHFIENTLVRTSIRSLGERELQMDKFVDDLCWIMDHTLASSQEKFMNPVFYYFAANFKKEFKEMLQKADKTMDSILHMIRDEKRKVERQAEKKVMVPETLMDFVVLGSSKKNILTEDEVLCELNTIFAAAFETTATVVTSVICLLALNVEVQKRVADEIESVFGHSDRPIASEDLSRLQYLETVIKESMRLFPPGSVLLRAVDDETDLNGTIVPKGSTVIFNILALHRNPRVFKDPLKFDPDRFALGAQEKRHPYAYLPFSSGARNCVGRLHAMMVMKTVLSTLLRNFRFFPGDKMKTFDDIKMKLCFTMRLCETSVRVIQVNGVHSNP